MLDAVGVPAKRALDQTREGGGDIPAPPILWEVKRWARFAVYEHVDQAIDAAPQYEGCAIPAVALRGDNREWLVVLRASDALPLLYRKQEQQELPL